MTSPSKYYAAAIKSVFFTVLILCAFACSNNDDPVSPTEDGEAYWNIFDREISFRIISNHSIR